jgi:MoxR-like ATPase
MWLVVVLVVLLWIIGGYIVYLLLQKKTVISEIGAPLSPSKDVFATNLSAIRIKHPVLIELKTTLQQHIVGMDWFINGLLVALLVKGHVLVEWVPGLAKTKTLHVLAHLLGLDFSRIQFTPDMLPSDIVWVDIYDSKTKTFENHAGPIFAHFVLADEINRATPKVQSALLEAMQEKQVTLGGKTMPLPDPFFVMATQNPLEHEGTYPLPEAQLDRFLCKILVDYPSAQEEKDILDVVSDVAPSIKKILSIKELHTLQDASKEIEISNDVKEYIVDLVQKTRVKDPRVLYGVSPRGSLSIMYAAQALALLTGKDCVTKTEVDQVALLVMRHRIVLQYQSKLQWYTEDSVLIDMLSA